MRNRTYSFRYLCWVERKCIPGSYVPLPCHEWRKNLRLVGLLTSKILLALVPVGASALMGICASGPLLAFEKEVSLVTGTPIGDLAVGGRLTVDLHAEFMLSRTWRTERALNWYNCGYSGGGAGGSTVGGNFGHFGFQVPFNERELRYPLAVSIDGLPAVRFDGDDFLKSNVSLEPAMIESGTMTLEVWFRMEAANENSVILGWQSVDGRSSSAPLVLPESFRPSTEWRHLVVNCVGDQETWWLDGKKGKTLPRRLLPAAQHVMILGGASSKLPSFKGEIAAVRLHDQAMTDDEIIHNAKGGVMLGTELKSWWRTEPDKWFVIDTEHFRQAIDKVEMEQWSEQQRKDFERRVPEMIELAEVCYHVYSERLAMRSSVVGLKPEDRGDGIKYRTPIQPSQGSWMGFDGRFGWACQEAGFINPHELVHGWQAMTGGMTGHFWETHANFPQTYLGVYQTIPLLPMETSIFPSNGRTYYHDRGFFEHLAQTPEYGPMFISKLWYDGPTPDQKDPLPWHTFEAINPYPDRTLSRERTRTAMRNVTWDYDTFVPFKVGVGYQSGIKDEENIYRKVALEQSAKPQQTLQRGHTLLERIPYDIQWWRVPRSQAPQQLGYNICPLDFKPGKVSAQLEGYVSKERGGDWHAGFVGVKADGTPVYGGIFRAGEVNSFEAGAELVELYLVVVATPTKILDIPMTGDYRSFEQEQFPWKVRLNGCEPRDLLMEPMPDNGGKRHSNGGGFVSSDSKVEDTAWVGPDARVLGKSQVLGMARIEDTAVISDSTVRDEAVVSGRAIVAGESTVSGRAKVRDTAVVKDATTITDDSRVLEHAVVNSRGTMGGQVTAKGLSAVYGGNQRGSAIIDGFYAKANEIDKGKWFTWSWGMGKNPGELDEEFAGLYSDYTFDQPHDWMARDDHGVTWGYLINAPAFVTRKDSLAEDEKDLALALNGKTQFVELPKDVADFRKATYSMSFKWDGKTQASRVFEFSGADGGMMALSPSTNGKMVFLIRADGKTQSIAAPSPSPNQWVNVRLVLDSPEAIIQINGETVAHSKGMSLRPDLVAATRCYVGRGSEGGFFGGEIGRFTVHSIPLIDKAPPVPDPATFGLAPSFVTPDTVLMSATKGEDPLGGVEYYFEEAGGRWNSGWTKERTFLLGGRDVSRPLQYRFRMRDRNGNLTAWSDVLRSAGQPSGTTFHVVGESSPVVIEAENALRALPATDGTSAWKKESYGTGFVGEGFMAVPDAGRRNDPFSVESARLDYALRFASKGSHYLWVRTSGNNDGGRMIHAGIGLDPGAWGLNVHTGFGRYAWTRLPAFEIKRPGDHLLSLWMCEDGAMLDRIVVTKDPEFEPAPETKDSEGVMTGPGPAATSPVTAP